MKRTALRVTAIGMALGVLAAGGRPGVALADNGNPVVLAAQTGSSVTGATEGQFRYVVFHAVDRDGFCDAAAFGAVSLHPVLGLPVDFFLESGDGRIIQTSSGNGLTAAGRAATGVRTFSTYANSQLVTPVKAFPPLVAGVLDECQAWVRVSQSIPGPLRMTVTVHGTQGDFVETATLAFTASATLALNFRWSLVTWPGADVAPEDALSGTGQNAGGTNVAHAVTALYAWDNATNRWLGYFPGVLVPGANDLASLKGGQAYWLAIAGPGPIDWRVVVAQ